MLYDDVNATETVSSEASVPDVTEIGPKLDVTFAGFVIVPDTCKGVIPKF